MLANAEQCITRSIPILLDALNAKGMRFPVDVILVCIRWYAAYPLNYRQRKEIMQERDVVVA
ncbi:IS6 family transposase [Neobacillus sp. YIM B02564]|uniref:IS6 family transposase n=1 Tax=Neobacillus paridis TaxID=2803862 RepID=A0ABS1TPD0_9BACI|nr:IS6 family transposase [Neobacillus paridis]